MDIYVLDKDFNAIELIDTYTSIIWTTRYYDFGDFELYLPVTNRLIEVLQRDYYLVRDKDILQENGKITYQNVMVIEDIEITTSVEDDNYLLVTGRDLKTILKRRIIWQQTNLSGKVELGIRQLIIENIINPTISARKISNFALGEIVGLTDTISAQYTGDELEEVISTLCKTYNYGHDIKIVNNTFVFYLYVGEDRSYNQTKNPYVVFSAEFENLLTTSYKVSSQEYRNVALIYGEGEGLHRNTATVGTAAGLYRYEKYVDGSGVTNNDGEYGVNEYVKLLEATGIESLQENLIEESFEGSTDTSLSYELNKDYFLGDVVQVINEYGISATPRILEIIESEDENGKTIIPTFSTLEV